MHDPYKEHLEAIHRILRYLKQSPRKGLFFEKNEKKNIEAFADINWAGSIVTWRNLCLDLWTLFGGTSGYCSYVWKNLETWSKKQGVVSRSTAEVKFHSITIGTFELLWLKWVLEELRIQWSGLMKLYSDNKSAISIAHNLVQHDRTKHVEVDSHFIKEKIEEKLLCMTFIPIRQQMADILTKGLPRLDFERLCCKLGMIFFFR